MITENDKRSRTESKHDKVLFNNRKLTILSKKYSDIWYQTGCNKCMLLGRWCSLKVVHECVNSVSFQPHWSRSQLENICLRLSCWSEAVKWMKQKNYVYQTKSTATYGRVENFKTRKRIRKKPRCLGMRTTIATIDSTIPWILFDDTFR